MGWQDDLLRPLDPNLVLTPAIREGLIPLLAALLLEAGAEDIQTETAEKEGVDEQDRN